MPIETNAFPALLVRAAQGEKQAINELFEQSQKATIQAIRFHLSRLPHLQRRFDAADFLKEAWLILLSQPEKLRECSTFPEFLRYLRRLAQHRLEHSRRMHLESEKRALRRVRLLSDPSIAVAAASVADSRPDPVQQAACRDLWLHWTKSLPWRQRVMLCMLLSGYTPQEIAASFRCCVRTIQRLVADLRATPSSDI